MAFQIIPSRGSFRRQIILTFGVGFFLLIAAFASYLVLTERDNLHRDSLNETTSTAQALAASARPWVLADDVAGLQEAVRAFRGYPEFSYALVISPAGRVLAHSDPSKVGMYLADEQSLSLLKAPHAIRVMADTPDMVVVAVPIEVGKQQVGWTMVGSLRQESTAYLRKMILNSILFLLASTALSFLAATVIANRLGQRIGSLVQVAEKVQSGNYFTRVDVAAGEDEIARLGNSMNKMLETLSQNERDLRAASLYTRSLIEASLDPLVTISPEGKITDVNAATEKATGLSRTALIGTDFSNYFTEPGKARQGYEEVFLKGSVTDYPLALRHRDGHVIDVLYNASVYRKGSGEVLGVFAAARDITERKRAEEVLRQNEEALKEAQRIAHLGSWHMDLATNQVFWSEELYKMYGYDPALPPPLYNESMKLFTPESWERLSAAIARAVETGTPYTLELEMVPKMGGRAWMLARGELVRDAEGKAVRVRGVVMDITERKKTEEALFEAQQVFRSLIESSPDIIARYDSDCRRTYVNPAYLKATEASPQELLGTSPALLSPLPPSSAAMVQNLLRKVLGTGAVDSVDVIWPKADNIDHWYNVFAFPEYGRDGQIVSVMTVSRDITEKKLFEVALRKASAYNRSLIESSLDPLVTISAEGKITDVNEATEKATGMSRIELIGTDFSGYFTEPEKAREGYQQVFQKGYVTDYPLALLNRDGRVIDVLYNASVYRDEAGKVLGVFAAARDITERKRAEQELAKLSLQNRLILDSAGEGIYGLDNDGRCTFANPAAAQLLGFEIGELIGQHSHLMFHHTKPDGSPFPAEECPVQTAYKQGVVRRGTDLYWRKDGSSFPVEFVSTPILESGKPAGAVVTFNDITKRKQTENELREKEERLALATVINGVGIWDWNLRTQEMIWDDSMYALYHMHREDFSGTEEAWRKSLHPDDLERGDKEVADAIAGIKPFDTEFRVVWPNGEIRHIKAVARVFRDADGTPVRMLGTNLDITERKQAEDALRKLNNDFVTLLENTGDFIYFKDQDNRFLFCSQTLANITGHSNWRDMIGKNDHEVFPEDTARIYYEEELPIFKEGKPLLNKFDPYYDEHGKRGWVITNKWPVFGDDNKTVVGIFGISRDITELKEAEDKINELNRDLEQRVVERTAQLEAANKELEAFSYSVSHDLRSPLRAIDGFSNILLEDYAGKLDDEGKRLVGVVRDNTIRMARLIDDILAFSRLGRKEMAQQVVDMAQLANETAGELASSWEGRNIKLEIGVLPPAHGDAAMLRQVWVNLLSNAIKFTRTRDAARVDVSGRAEGSELVYCVKDNGVGFDMQYSDKLFGVFQRLHSAEEFEGTGAGLAIVKRIVSRHGGRVWANGKIGEGAEFYFALPANADNDLTA